MLSTLVVTIVVWTAVALVAGVLIGRLLRRRAAAHEAERPGFRNSA
jgi:hypothetical protein